MMKIKLGSFENYKPVKLTIELLAAVFRDLKKLRRRSDAKRRRTTPTDPAKLIAPMIEHFLAADRAFAKARRNAAHFVPGLPERSG
ncbi:DUF2274 domain-containing protein [Bradyrhizobium sp. USDA 3315]